MAKKEIKLGNTVKDIVTGFTGIATANVTYLNGCIQLCIRPPLNEKKERPDAEYIDIAQLVYVDDGVINDIEVYSAEPPGSDVSPSSD